MVITRINPEPLHRNPVFSQAISVSGGARLIFVGGQNGVNRNGEIVGKDVSGQAEQAMRNLLSALDAAGARLEDVVKMTVYLVQGQSLQEAFGAAQRVMGANHEPPTVSVLVVAGLARPDFLIEIEAVAAVDEGGRR